MPTTTDLAGAAMAMTNASQDELWVLDSRTGGEWRQLAIDPVPQPRPPFEDGYPRAELHRALSDVALSQHLGLLVGIGPSVGVGGPTMSDLWESISRETGDRFKQAADAVGYDLDGGDIEAFLTRCHLWLQLRTDSVVSEFVKRAESVIADSCRSFLNALPELPDHEAFLRKLARRSSERSRARLFTTNYDLCFERASRATGFVVTDGFGRNDPPLFDAANFEVDLVRRPRDDRPPEYLENVFHLLKLHGSVDWAETGGEIVRQAKPDRPLLIFPRGDKFELSYKQPFIELIGRFHAYLRQPHLGLLIVGFGFSDAHLSEAIQSAAQRNASLKLLVATLGARRQTDDPKRKALGTLRRMAAAGDGRITLIDTTFSRLVAEFPDLGQPSEGALLRGVLSKVLRQP